MALKTEVKSNPSHVNVEPVILEEYNTWRIPVPSSIFKKGKFLKEIYYNSRLTYALRNERVFVGRGIEPVVCLGQQDPQLAN